METTKQDALKFYEIVKYINPYEVCDLDKNEIIKNIMELDFDNNLEQLQDYICNVYDDTRNLIEDEKCIKLYLNILRRKKRNGR